jgi:hypothetical protein
LKVSVAGISATSSVHDNRSAVRLKSPTTIWVKGGQLEFEPLPHAPEAKAVTRIPIAAVRRMPRLSPETPGDLNEVARRSALISSRR